MEWIRICYEKIKPFLIPAVLVLIVFIMVRDIVGSNRYDEQQRAFQRTVESLDLVSSELGGIVSDISELTSGISDLKGTSDLLKSGIDDLSATSERLETSILSLGDTSTESGLNADRLYRISRELAKRESETTE